MPFELWTTRYLCLITYLFYLQIVHVMCGCMCVLYVLYQPLILLVTFIYRYNVSLKLLVVGIYRILSCITTLQHTVCHLQTSAPWVNSKLGTYTTYIYFYLILAFDFCRFCMVIRLFHPRDNGQ